jgi:hypothetical protein
MVPGQPQVQGRACRGQQQHRRGQRPRQQPVQGRQQHPLARGRGRPWGAWGLRWAPRVEGRRPQMGAEGCPLPHPTAPGGWQALVLDLPWVGAASGHPACPALTRGHPAPPPHPHWRPQGWVRQGWGWQGWLHPPRGQGKGAPRGPIHQSRGSAAYQVRPWAQHHHHHHPPRDCYPPRDWPLARGWCRGAGRSLWRGAGVRDRQDPWGLTRTGPDWPGAGGSHPPRTRPRAAARDRRCCCYRCCYRCCCRCCWCR